MDLRDRSAAVAGAEAEAEAAGDAANADPLCTGRRTAHRAGAGERRVDQARSGNDDRGGLRIAGRGIATKRERGGNASIRRRDSGAAGASR